VESEYCIFTIAIAVVVTIVVLSLIILARDIIRYFYKKSQISNAPSTAPSRANKEGDYK
jgi:hypothetical protein